MQGGAPHGPLPGADTAQEIGAGHFYCCQRYRKCRPSNIIERHRSGDKIMKICQRESANYNEIHIGLYISQHQYQSVLSDSIASSSYIDIHNELHHKSIRDCCRGLYMLYCGYSIPRILQINHSENAFDKHAVNNGGGGMFGHCHDRCRE